jgi:hypothetical protein
MLQLAQIHTMRNINRSLLLIIAGATQEELGWRVRYLKVENQILRSKLPARVPVTEKEKNRLVRFAAKLGRVQSIRTTLRRLDSIALTLVHLVENQSGWTHSWRQIGT